MPGRAPLVYVWVDDVETTGVTVEDQPWGRELPVQDLDGDRLRIAVPVGQRNVDAQFGEGTVEMLTALEHAMWDELTRGDRSWMAAHLTEDFGEFGYSGRTYTLDDILDQPVGPITLSLRDVTVRSVGR